MLKLRTINNLHLHCVVNKQKPTVTSKQFSYEVPSENEKLLRFNFFQSVDLDSIPLFSHNKDFENGIHKSPG